MSIRLNFFLLSFQRGHGFWNPCVRLPDRRSSRRLLLLLLFVLYPVPDAKETPCRSVSLRPELFLVFVF